jgi:hypothetical protein
MTPTEERARANQHRPQAMNELRAAARQMLLDGLGDYSVADALQMSVEQLRRLIGPCQTCDE